MTESNPLSWSQSSHVFIFFFNDTATTEIYTLSLHDALPIFDGDRLPCAAIHTDGVAVCREVGPACRNGHLQHTCGSSCKPNRNRVAAPRCRQHQPARDDQARAPAGSSHAFHTSSLQPHCCTLGRASCRGRG